MTVLFEIGGGGGGAGYWEEMMDKTEMVCKKRCDELRGE